MGRAAAGAARQRRQPGKPGLRARVLIVEDDREIAELIQLYLEREGIEVEKAEAAEPGLVALAQRPCDLIILDINLPETDGFEFLRQCRRHTEIPVIIVSARDADEDKIFGFGVGADDFVTKPFSPKVLTARVRAHLRRNQRQEGIPGREVRRFGSFQLDLDACTLEDSLRASRRSGAQRVPAVAHPDQRPGAHFLPRTSCMTPSGATSLATCRRLRSTSCVCARRSRRQGFPDSSKPFAGSGTGSTLPQRSDSCASAPS